MEENNSNNEEFKQVDTNPVNKKKKLGPVKGILLAILIVFLIVVVGLLIRMVVADDGDYFLPFKKMFGIEEEEDRKTKKEKEPEEKTTSKTSVSSAERLSKLSSDATAKDVEHYTVNVSLKELMNMGLATLTTNGDASELTNSLLDGFMDNNDMDDNWNYDDNDDYNWDDDDYDDWNYDDEDEDDYNWDEEDDDEVLDNMSLDDIAELMEGEIIVDLYTKGNEVVQVVVGIDYMDLLKNLYDYALELETEEVEAFDTFEDYADYIKTTLKMYLNKEMLVESIADEVSDYIDEDELADMIDIVNDRGLFELYFTVNDDLNDQLQDYLDEYSS